MNKKLLIILLALLMALAVFTGCSQSDIDTAFDVAETVIDIANALESEESPAPDASVQQTPAPATPAPEAAATPAPAPEAEPEDIIDPDGEYSSPEDVAAYLHTYGRLPKNFLTKNEARDLGWDNSKGNLWDVAPGMSIGGDRFGNYEGLLPEGKYTECDVNYAGGYRGSERLVFDTDGNIYYTADHYESFEKLY